MKNDNTTPGKKSNAFAPNLQSSALSAVSRGRQELTDEPEEYIPRSAPALPQYDEPVMPRTRRRRTLKFDELYDPLSSYIDKRYVQAFETLVNEAGPNKTAVLNEAIYDLLQKKRDILAEYGVDVESLPKPRK